VEQLEVLLFLGENPATPHSVQNVFRRIQSSENSVTQCLEFFIQEQLVIKDANGYRISDASPDLIRLLDDLQTVYRERRVAVIEIIYQKRSSRIQSFADAFQFRRKKE
jgi:predicted transcriptional regulator